MQCQKADPILIEQKNLINMAECVATVQDNGTIIRNRSRNASLSVCHSRVLPSVIDLAIATALPIVCREEKNSGKSFFAGLQEGRECCNYKYKDIIFFIHFCVFLYFVNISHLLLFLDYVQESSQCGIIL